MTLLVEEEQQRVAAELEQPAAVRVRDVEERLERRVHHLGHLLGARLALPGELLRHRREAGDVDERERAFKLAVASLGSLAEPFDDDPRDERRQVDRLLQLGYRLLRATLLEVDPAEKIVRPGEFLVELFLLELVRAREPQLALLLVVLLLVLLDVLLLVVLVVLVPIVGVGKISGALFRGCMSIFMVRLVRRIKRYC